MAETEKKNNLYCNYCGESLSLEVAYNHVSTNHEGRIHPDPTTYRPGRRRRVRMTQIIGSVVFMVSLVLILVIFGHQMTGQIALILLMSYVAGILALYGGGEYYARRGEKPAWDIMMDLTIECDICYAKVPWREKEMHDELNHPEEKEVVRRVYTPAAIVLLTLVGIGFAGMAIVLALAEGELLSQSSAIIGFLSFLICAICGMVFGLVFEFRYHRPRVDKLRDEWSAKHGHNYRSESEK